MRAGIRVDANKTVATGHLMRCIAIANAWKNCGENPLFITADAYPKQFIEQKGYDCISLESDWKYMEEETEKLEHIIRTYNIGMLLVDSYYVTKSYLKKIHGLTKVAYLDDLCEDVYEVDTLICYANYYKKFSLETKYLSTVSLMLGTEYVPLRPAFFNLPSKSISPELKELIVLSGGSDPYDFLWHFSDRISKSSLVNSLEKIHIICGKYYDKYELLIQKFASDSKLHFHMAVDEIERYMFSADVAVSAAGVTSYELCAVGTPTITYITADNQKQNAESFQEEGLMEYAGDLRCDPVLDRVMELLEGMYQDAVYRKNISEAMRKKVDGKGAWRIAKKLEIQYLGYTSDN